MKWHVLILMAVMLPLVLEANSGVEHKDKKRIQNHHKISHKLQAKHKASKPIKERYKLVTYYNKRGQKRHRYEDTQAHSDILPKVKAVETDKLENLLDRAPTSEDSSVKIPVIPASSQESNSTNIPAPNIEIIN